MKDESKACALTVVRVKMSCDSGLMNVEILLLRWELVDEFKFD